MRPRWRKVLADLWANRTRSILVVASITVGLFAIGVITNLYLVMSDDMRAGYSGANPANTYVSAVPFDQDMVDHIGRMDGVVRAEGARNFDLRLEARQGEWIGLALKSVPDFHEMEINRIRPVEGTWPPGDREIVLDQYRLADTHASLGDSITIELPSGKTRSLKLVGVIQDQTIGAFEGGSGGFFTASVQGYITRGTLEWLEQDSPELFNTLYVTSKQGGDERQLEALTAQVRDELEKNGVHVFNTTYRSSFDHPNRNLVDAIIGVLLVLGLLVVFLSGFLITNTLQALLDQQIEQIGIMKTVGARRLQIAGIYMGLILIFGLVALAISVPLSNQTAFALMDILAGEINIITKGSRIFPGVLALQAILALLVPQLAAFLPIWQGSRISVQEALSGIRQNSAPGRGRFDRWLGRLRQLSRPMRISLRNAFRRKGRLLLTLVTLSLGGAIFIATFNVQVSMSKYIDMIAGYFLADVNLFVGQPYRISEMKSLLAEVPGVGYVEGWAAARSELVLDDGSAGESVQLLAPPANSPLVTPILMQGRWIRPGDTNAIALNDHFLAEFPNLKLGDTIRLRVNGRETEWEIVGFFQLGGKVSGLLAYGNYDYLSERIGQPNQATAFRVVSSQPGIGSDGQESLAQAIEAHLQAQNVDIVDISTGSYISNTSSEGFSILTAFLLFLALLTAMVGSIGLAGTMSMNVMERTREIGVMRAVGASNTILMKMVIMEGMIIGFISWLAGSLLAFPISKVLSDSISLALFDSPSNFGFTVTGFVLWFLAVTVLSILASVMPARKAARLTIREVLAYE